MAVIGVLHQRQGEDCGSSEQALGISEKLGILLEPDRLWGERSAYAPRREFEDWLLSMGIFAAGKLPRADPNTRCLRWREVDESGH